MITPGVASNMHCNAFQAVGHCSGFELHHPGALGFDSEYFPSSLCTPTQERDAGVGEHAEDGWGEAAMCMASIAELCPQLDSS